MLPRVVELLYRCCWPSVAVLPFPQAERGMLPAAFAKRGPHGVSTLSIVASATGVAFLGLLGFEAIVEILNLLCESLGNLRSVSSSEREKLDGSKYIAATLYLRQTAGSRDSQFSFARWLPCADRQDWLATRSKIYKQGALVPTIRGTTTCAFVFILTSRIRAGG